MATVPSAENDTIGSKIKPNHLHKPTLAYREELYKEHTLFPDTTRLAHIVDAFHQL